MTDDDFAEAADFGTGYALYRHGQDRLAAQIGHAVRVALDTWEPPFENHSVSTTASVLDVRPVDLDLCDRPLDWEDFIGQERIKSQLQMRIASAGVRHGRLPHHLLIAEGSGMGRRALVRMAASAMGVRLVELVAPFRVETLVAALGHLGDKDVLFIDEIDRACRPGVPGALVLQQLIEGRSIPFADGDETYVPEITVVATARQVNDVPAPVLDCFPVLEALDPYSTGELGQLAVHFMFMHRSQDLLDDDAALAIAQSSNRSPRSVERLVLAARDFALAMDRPPSDAELLELAGGELR